MSSVSTCLIEDNVFFREGLKSLLADSPYHIEKTYQDCHTATKELTGTGPIKLFIIGAEKKADRIKAQISMIKKGFPESRIAVLALLKEPNVVLTAFSAGADGYILHDIAPAALKSSLDMIMAGEKVCPAAILNIFLKEGSNQNTTTAQSELNGYNLSARETQILKYLANGETNKGIARELNITEATVKVHIKTVLRKLGLSNRTQAAVWAVNKGVTH